MRTQYGDNIGQKWRAVAGLAGVVGTALSEQLMKAGAVTARMRNDTTYCMLGEINYGTQIISTERCNQVER